MIRSERRVLATPPIVAGRVPPHDLDAEAAVLSAMLLDRNALDCALEILKPEHFYSDANNRIFEAARELSIDNKPVDRLTVVSYLRDRDRLASVGGAAYVWSLVDDTPFRVKIATYAGIVFRKWRLRSLISLCQITAAEGYGDVGDEQEFLDSHEQAVYELTHLDSTSSTVTLKSAVTRTFAKMVAAAERGERITGISTGFEKLDGKTSGLHAGDLTIVAGRPSMGKAQPLDAKVLTPTGWRLMGDLRVGDMVIGADGLHHSVLGVFDRGDLPIFRVTMDDGGSTVCCDEHLWYTRTRKDRKAKRYGTVKSLREVRATILRAGDGGRNHSLPFMAAAHFSGGQLPLDPWLMGAYLGDGDYATCVRISKPEPDFLRRVEESLPPGDCVTELLNDAQQVVGVRVRKPARGPERSEMAKALTAFGLEGLESHEKFIPDVYLYATVADRLRLLRGLCDADGYVTDPGGKSIELSTSSVRLRDGIQFLVGSLGGCVTWVEKQGVYTKEGVRHETLMSYRMVLSFPRGDIVPVSTEKHLAKWNDKATRISERFIASVKPIGSARCRCIAVDTPDHLYVTDDFIVTHNTAFAMNVAVNVASEKVDDKYVNGVVFFSLEMSEDQIASRTVCSEGRVDIGKMRQGFMQPADWSRVTEAASYLAGPPIWIDETPVSVLGLRSKVRRLQAEFDREGRKLALVVVDYLQLMKVDERGGSREQEVSGISRGLKILAKELGVAVVALSQLSRAVETRAGKDKRPMLSDLRESGSLEQDADTVIFIYRDEYYNPETTEAKGIAELIVAKQRNGPTGRVLTKFNASCTRFDNLSPADSAQYQENE